MPYKLLDRDDGNGNEGDNQVMIEDGLLEEVKKDFIGDNYFKMEHSDCFGEPSILVVEWPVSRL